MSFFLFVCYCFNTCRLRFKFASEGFTAILHRHGVTALCVGRDINAEGYDAACIDGLFIDDVA